MKVGHRLLSLSLFLCDEDAEVICNLCGVCLNGCHKRTNTGLRQAGERHEYEGSWHVRSPEDAKLPEGDEEDAAAADEAMRGCLQKSHLLKWDDVLLPREELAQDVHVVDMLRRWR